MKRLLFTFPDDIAHALRENVASGERSKFIVEYIRLPLKKLTKTKAKKRKIETRYKSTFLRDVAKAQKQVNDGEVYTEEEIMKEFGLL